MDRGGIYSHKQNSDDDWEKYIDEGGHKLLCIRPNFLQYTQRLPATGILKFLIRKAHGVLQPFGEHRRSKLLGDARQ